MSQIGSGILVAYDGSDHARRALERAAEIADGRGVTVVSVVSTPFAPQPGTSGLAESEERQRELEEARSLLAAKGIEANLVEARGDPADAIVSEAEKAEAGLIIVGTRGLNAAQRAWLGSVSTDIVHRAPCDVLVVR